MSLFYFKKFFIISVLFFCWTSCLMFNKSVKENSFRLLECDTTLNCSVSENNNIYVPNRLFKYKLTTSINEVTSEDFKEIFNSDRDSLFLVLKILPGCFYDQTKIKYEYFLGDSLYHWELTGVVEDSDYIWMHPPRSVLKGIAEYAPFPTYKFNELEWKSRRMGTVSFREEFKTQKKDTIFQFKNETLKCDIVKIKTLHKGSEYMSYLIFNDSYGFVEIKYNLLNGKSFHLKLVDYDINYCR